MTGDGVNRDDRGGISDGRHKFVPGELAGNALRPQLLRDIFGKVCLKSFCTGEHNVFAALLQLAPEGQPVCLGPTAKIA